MITPEQTMRRRSEALVVALVGLKYADTWWSSNNKAFESLTPKQAWDKDPSVVYSYLMGTASGGYL
jgi:hypothetical protein